MPARSIHATLTRHFLRRFLENDLISPEADRSQLLAIVGAALFSVMLLVTVFMSFQYVMAVRTPSQLALAALNDKYFYLSLSMIVSALLAVVQWDSLVVDIRDAAILEPLPVRPTAIRAAKVAAVATLGAGAAVIVNVMPTLVFPWLLVYHTRVPSSAMLVLIAAHAAVTCAAAGFAYAAIVALRETLAALFPARWLLVLSPTVQGTLIVVLGSALLLTPAASTRIAQRGFSTAHMTLPLVGSGLPVIAPDWAGYANYGAPNNPPSAYANSVDVAKIRGLGWTPAHRMADALTETVLWYEASEA